LILWFQMAMEQTFILHKVASACGARVSVGARAYGAQVEATAR
jgi:hypothetical protein